jgi:2-dehydro-3-deoxyphosphogluconate aldolase / (4S)-4-hydroxy-2-oxoglutarate aldolase
MATGSWLSFVQSQRAIAVIRAPSVEVGMQMARAVMQGGMRLIEIAWNSQQPATLVHQLRLEQPACLIGAGTILNLDQCWEAIAAGSQFFFTPYVNLEMIQTAVEQQVPIIPGALSPTEIVTAWQAGAVAVKVFPIQAVGGATYIRHLQGPLGHIPLIPTGGVTIDNASEFLDAGALAVGLSTQLFPAEALKRSDWDEVTQRARKLLRSVGG